MEKSKKDLQNLKLLLDYVKDLEISRFTKESLILKIKTEIDYAESDYIKALGKDIYEKEKVNDITL